MAPSPRVLLSIDYEPWFALIRRYDSFGDSMQRRDLDEGFTSSALEIILRKLGNSKGSFFLVGEIATWYPEVPGKILEAGHELGLHCQLHRPLVSIDELEADIRAAASWNKKYGVRGYRAPMIGISEAAYPLLERAGFQYSSSIYAPAGTLIRKGGMWELPVSTYRLFDGGKSLSAPRDFSPGLLVRGEVPYGSSLTIGVLGSLVFRILRRELDAGHSPVIILHPYELVSPERWPRRILRDLVRDPRLWPFTWSKADFLERLLEQFPVSSLGAYLDEVLRDQAGN